MPLETISPQSLSKRRKIWRDNPIRFLTEALDVAPGHVWSKMAEIAGSAKEATLLSYGELRSYGYLTRLREPLQSSALTMLESGPTFPEPVTAAIR